MRKNALWGEEMMPTVAIYVHEICTVVVRQNFPKKKTKVKTCPGAWQRRRKGDVGEVPGQGSQGALCWKSWKAQFV